MDDMKLFLFFGGKRQPSDLQGEYEKILSLTWKYICSNPKIERGMFLAGSFA